MELSSDAPTVVVTVCRHAGHIFSGHWAEGRLSSIGDWRLAFGPWHFFYPSYFFGGFACLPKVNVMEVMQSISWTVVMVSLSHTHTHTHTHTQKHTCTQTQTHADTYTHTHTHTNTQMHRETHRHADTDTQRYTQAGKIASWSSVVQYCRHYRYDRT